ncbi:hypothetical protein ACKAMS_32340 [Rhodococcus sp. 5A-K4]
MTETLLDLGALARKRRRTRHFPKGERSTDRDILYLGFEDNDPEARS